MVSSWLTFPNRALLSPACSPSLYLIFIPFLFLRPQSPPLLTFPLPFASHPSVLVICRRGLPLYVTHWRCCSVILGWPGICTPGNEFRHGGRRPALFPRFIPGLGEVDEGRERGSEKWKPANPKRWQKALRLHAKTRTQSPGRFAESNVWKCVYRIHVWKQLSLFQGWDNTHRD